MNDFQPNSRNGVVIPYNSSVAELKNQIMSPGPRAWAAIEALSRKNDSEALALLKSLTQSPDWRFRRSAIEAIGLSTSGQDFAADILRLLFDSNKFVIRSAIEASGKLGLKKAHDRIHDLLKSTDKNTRIVALITLKDLWLSTDFDRVFKLYMNDPSEEVRKQAAWTIRSNISSEHWQKVFSTWSKDSIPRHRIWACDLFEEFGNTSDISMLQSLLNDRDGHVRKAAKRVIQHL